jgi:hypothetical protein
VTLNDRTSLKKKYFLHGEKMCKNNPVVLKVTGTGTSFTGWSLEVLDFLRILQAFSCLLNLKVIIIMTVTSNVTKEVRIPYRK